MKAGWERNAWAFQRKGYLCFGRLPFSLGPNCQLGTMQWSNSDNAVLAQERTRRLVEQERRPDTDPSGHTDIYDPGGAQPRGEQTHFAKSGAGTVEY